MGPARRRGARGRAACALPRPLRPQGRGRAAPAAAALHPSAPNYHTATATAGATQPAWDHSQPAAAVDDPPTAADGATATAGAGASASAGAGAGAGATAGAGA